MTPTRKNRVSESLTMPVSAFATALRIMLTSLVSRETSRPDAVSWKKARSKRRMWANTRLCRSAMTRWPTKAISTEWP